MAPYDSLKKESPVYIDDQSDLPEGIKGLYIETGYTQMILLNKDLPVQAEKRCVLAEELGHYYTTFGNITDQTDLRNRKHEKRARNWAYEKLVPLDKLVEASRLGIRNRFELAEYLEVTEPFLEEALLHFKEKYGFYATFENYLVYFEPLGVLERFEF
ncbi:MAG: rane protein [Paenibacillaceae bacterium]|jgi:Zn-dependent peptidase ImmA (M78 family)|nr:rane protein [Paenibacillaceae bacterium]